MTTVYVDSSALLKRVLIEPESAALADALRSHATGRDLLVASTLAWVEVWRALRRAPLPTAADVGAAGEDATAGIAELPLDDEILRDARDVGGDLLRSLDAIHLASALRVGADVLLTYDERLAAAARAGGLTVGAPT